MRLFWLLLFCKYVACLSGKQKYCQAIAQQRLYPEIDIERFCNSYVITINDKFCCIKESNLDDVLPQTCLPISQFLSGSNYFSTLRPHVFRTKPTLPMMSTKRLPTDTTSSTKRIVLNTLTTTMNSILDDKQNSQPTSTSFGKEIEQSSSTAYDQESSSSVSFGKVIEQSSSAYDQESSSSVSFGNLHNVPDEVENLNKIENGDVLHFTDNWVLRFQRSIQQASHNMDNVQEDVIISLFRESIQEFVREFKQMYNKDHVCPQNDYLTSDSTFVKTPFDFTLQNIWNAFFYANEWSPKFTFPNFMIDQQTGILVTVLATLIAAFCDKTTRDRLALLTDELSQVSCIEQFCCPSLFHILKLIFRRAKNPPPRKILKKKFKHLPKTPMEHISCDDPNTIKKNNLKNPHYNTKPKKNNKLKKARIIFSKKNQPETRIEIENELNDDMPCTNISQENVSTNKPCIPASSDCQLKKKSYQPDFDRISVVANVHHSSNSN